MNKTTKFLEGGNLSNATKNLKLHFLKVSEDGKGDCTIIELPDGEVMIIDIRNGRTDGSHNLECENPIDYLKNITNSKLYRYIQTHPDMDHLDGFLDIINEFGINNFWDTKNNRVKPENFSNEYRENDWDSYRNDSKDHLHYFERMTDSIVSKTGPYMYQLYPLSPTSDLVKRANETSGDDYNILSYVILLCYKNCKILFGGDIPDSVWTEIEECRDSNPKLEKLLSNVTIFKASHHGRKSGYCGNSFLKKINPRFIIADDNVESSESAYDEYKYFLDNRDPTGWVYSAGKKTVIAEYVEGDGTTLSYK